MTQRQNFDATAGMVWTIFSVLSIGHHVKFDAAHQKRQHQEICLCENP